MTSVNQRVKQKVWSQDWPESVALDFGSSVKLASEENSQHTNSFSLAREEVSAVLGKGAPVSLSRVSKLLNRLDEWHRQHESYMTWPPTVSGWNRAVRETAKDDTLDFIVLAACYPNAVKNALVHWNGLERCAVASWYAKAYDEGKTVEASSKQDVRVPEGDKKIEPSPPVESSVAAPTLKVAPPAPSWILELLDMAREMQSSSHRGLVSEKIDGFVKTQILQKKGSSDEAAGFWFEDELVPGLSHLTSPQLEDVIAGWPIGLKFPLNNPIKTVGQGRFWAGLKVAGDSSRETMLLQVLPALTETSSWRAVDRHQMLQPLFEMAKSEAEFNKRLGLWLAWGGELDAEIPDPAVKSSTLNDNAFQVEATPMVSARRWFLQQNNPRWATALAAYPERTHSRSFAP